MHQYINLASQCNIARHWVANVSILKPPPVRLANLLQAGGTFYIDLGDLLINQRPFSVVTGGRAECHREKMTMKKYGQLAVPEWLLTMVSSNATALNAP